MASLRHASGKLVLCLTLAGSLLAGCSEITGTGMDRVYHHETGLDTLSAAVDEVTPEQADLLRMYVPLVAKEAAFDYQMTLSKSKLEELEGMTLREIVVGFFEREVEKADKEIEHLQWLEEQAGKVHFAFEEVTLQVPQRDSEDEPTIYEIYNGFSCAATLKVTNESELHISVVDVRGESKIKDSDGMRFRLGAFYTEVEWPSGLAPGASIEQPASCSVEERGKPEALAVLLDKGQTENDTTIKNYRVDAEDDTRFPRDITGTTAYNSRNDFGSDTDFSARIAKIEKDKEDALQKIAIAQQ